MMPDSYENLSIENEFIKLYGYLSLADNEEFSLKDKSFFTFLSLILGINNEANPKFQKGNIKIHVAIFYYHLTLFNAKNGNFEKAKDSLLKLTELIFLETKREDVFKVVLSEFIKVINDESNSEKGQLYNLYKANNGKISDKWESYLNFYDENLYNLKDKPIRMLEIGIQNGGSLEIWSKYFANAQVLVGCDINEQCGELEYDDPRIKLVIGDSSSEDTFRKISSNSTFFDLIIDDGSHKSSDCIKNFCLYYPLLTPGGVYIVEDVHCSYWVAFEGAIDNEKSTMSFFKRLTDVVNGQFWIDRKFSITSYIPEVASNAEKFLNIESIYFENSVIKITKSLCSQATLGKRIIVGEKGLITGDDYVLSNGSFVNHRK